MDLGFKGKVALVTGAGSQKGFGKEIALTLAREGCEAVVVTDVIDDVQKTAEEVRKIGSKSLAIPADITNQAEVETMVRKTLGQFKKIDILCNVAGAILQKDYMPIDTQNTEIWKKQMDLNLFGMMYVSRAVVPQMREMKQGAIVNIGSGSTHQFKMGVQVYAISKYAIELFTKQLAYVEGKYGIRCNCIAPGPAPTNFGEVLRQGSQGSPPPTPEQIAKAREGMLAEFPLGRLGAPTDITNISVLMVSEATSYITGQVIQVSGGNVME
jgi:NAD(P)-dependent dehydrogenase (short-subunit alcohol dehydrogenase family)